MNYKLSLDLGTHKMVMVASRALTTGKVEILAQEECPSVGMEQGVIKENYKVARNVQNLFQAISKTLEAKFGTIPPKPEYILVGVAGSHTKIKKVSAEVVLPNAAKNHVITGDDHTLLLDKIIKEHSTNENESIINILPSSYLLDDFETTNAPIGMSGQKIKGNFLLVTGKVSSIQNITTSCSSIGIKNTQLLLEPLASSFLGITEKEKQKGVVLVDIGGGTTDVAIFKGNAIINSKIFPIGGEAVTRDIKSTLNIETEEAEKLKISYGDTFIKIDEIEKSLSLKELGIDRNKNTSTYSLSQIIFSRYYEIARFCYSQIKNSGLSFGDIEKIVLTGGGSLQKNLPEMFEYLCDLSCKRSSNYSGLIENFDEKLTSPVYSTTIGLISENHLHTYIRPGHTEEEKPMKESPERQKKNWKVLSNLKGHYKKFSKEYFN